jgi:CBS-domain-containing membrane protein
MSVKGWIKADQRFKALWINYLYQSALATLVLFVVLLILSTREIAIVTSIGGVAFTMFVAPSSPTAHPVRVIGGQIVACLCGGLGLLFLHTFSFSPIAIESLVVGLAIFVMISANLFQPPAAGTALGIAITGEPLKVLLTVVISVIIMLVAQHYL